MFIEARRTEVVLAPPNKKSYCNSDGVPREQIWELQTQRPGSGILDVECLHKGPTLVSSAFRAFVTTCFYVVGKQKQILSFLGRANHRQNEACESIKFADGFV